MRFLFFSLAAVTGFTISPNRFRASSEIRLLPEQGCQLVAAWEAAAVHLHDEVEATKAPEDELAPSGTARAFVSRVFSLPASLLHPHPQEQLEKEVLYYPIVGFEFVPGSKKALPTLAVGNAACRIPPADEALYGWFSPACLLAHPDSDDYTLQPHED